LVHLGLVDDPRLGTEAPATPMNLRVSALITATCLGTGLALGVLRLAGVDVTWQTPVALAVIFGIAGTVAWFFASVRHRRSTD
jgi:hypothetical protein